MGWRANVGVGIDANIRGAEGFGAEKNRLAPGGEGGRRGRGRPLAAVGRARGGTNTSVSSLTIYVFLSTGTTGTTI